MDSTKAILFDSFIVASIQTSLWVVHMFIVRMSIMRYHFFGSSLKQRTFADDRESQIEDPYSLAISY